MAIAFPPPLPLLLGLLVSVAACPAMARSSNDAAPARKYEGVLPVELHLGQVELVVESVRTDAMAAGGGVLGVMIATGLDNAAAKKDEVRVGPIRDVMLGVDLNTRFTQALVSGLDAPALAESLAFEVHPESRRARQLRIALPSRERVLDLDLQYALTPGFRSLRVSANALLGVRTVDRKILRPKGHRLFRVEYLVPLPGDEKGLKEDQRAALWASLGQEKIVSLVESGIAEVVAMLNYWLPEPGHFPADAPRARYDLGAGRLVRERDGMRWIRVSKGLLVATP